MPVKVNIVITQFETEDRSSSAREVTLASQGEVTTRESTVSSSSSSTQTHHPAVTQPAASSVTGGWNTPTPEDEFWTDSYTLSPDLLFRKRFSWGRDVKEYFPQPAKPGHGDIGINSGPGARWGNLDSVAGILLYQKSFARSSSISMLEFKVHGQVSISESLNSISEASSVHELGVVVGEFTVREYPFVNATLPVPNSVKNPVATDIYIRLGNFTSVFDPDSFQLYVDDTLQATLSVDEFFAGLGGYDVTWSNTSLFEYDAQVDVRWEFRDLEIPANLFVVNYPFYTVSDTAGPRVSTLIPADTVTSVPIDSSIQFDVEDFESDVDIDSLILYVNNVKAVDGETGNLQLNRFDNEKGYTVKYTPFNKWLYGDLIPVTLFVKDTSKGKNETFYSYSFTTMDSIAPRLLNTQPLVCNLAIPTGAHISLDLVDAGHGLNKDSIVFTVEDIEKSGQIALIPIIHRDE